MAEITKELEKNGYALGDYVIYDSANKYESLAVIKAFRDDNTVDLECIVGEKRSTQRTRTLVDSVSFSKISKAAGRMQYNMDDDVSDELEDDIK